MVTSDEARRMALALPESAEADHHGFPSFRVRGKIFATLPDKTRVHVMIDADEVEEAVAESPQACEELWWGRRLSGVRVQLAAVDPAVLNELLSDAWRRKAPASLRGESRRRGPSQTD